KTQLNAFDRCFYYSDPESITKKIENLQYWEKLKEAGRKGNPTIQDFFRLRSLKLRSSIVDGNTVSHRHGELHASRVELSADELSEISTIIGRAYSAGFLMNHRFYGGWGVSAYFQTESRSYSEAFAGSGESAVAQLVHEVLSGESSRLLLLDEPETSLHPGAQERMLDFLLRNVSEKKLQIVISSHSPVFVRNLPSEAIHLFRLGADDRVEHLQNVNADEAFYSIGHPPENVIQFYVGDILAKQMLDSVIKNEGPEFASRFQVSFYTGGSDAMKQGAVYLQIHEFRRRAFFLFDGDQQDRTSKIELSDISLNSTKDDVDQHIKTAYGCNLKFLQDSNMPDKEKVKLRVEFIEFANGHFHCMPFDTPEAVLWDIDTAAELVEQFASDDEAIDREKFDALTPKSRFETLTELIRPDHEPVRGEEINFVQRMFLNRFSKEQGPHYVALRELVIDISKNA
ncbi:MAG: hypothetical protein ACI8UO_000920, partial [Verrucomicrobiales bacterium]